MTMTTPSSSIIHNDDDSGHPTQHRSMTMTSPSISVNINDNDDQQGSSNDNEGGGPPHDNNPQLQHCPR